MPRFKRIEDPGSGSALAALYREILDSGMGSDIPINWFTAQSERPDILEATWRLTKGLLLSGQLPSTVKQMLLVAVSMQNNCRYCRVLHTEALDALGVPREVIDNLTTDVSLQKLAPTQRAIVQFGLKAAREPSSVTDDDIGTLRQLGLNRGEILEVAMMSAFANFVNTWADVSAIEVEQP